MASVLKVNEIQHTGGTSALTVNSSGYITQNQIPYLICNETAGATITPTAYNGVIVWNNVIASRGISMNTTTGRFTVPINGLYNINCAVRFQSELPFVYWMVVDYNSGSQQTVQAGKLVLAHSQSLSGFTATAGSVLLSLETGKEYQINGNTSSGASVAVYADQTWLDVHLVA